MLTITLLKNDEIKPYLAEMWGVYSQYYNDPKELFMARAMFFDCQAMFYDKQKLVGFTAITVDRNISIGDKQHTFIGLNQSVIDKAYRNQNLIQRLCTRLFLQERWKNLFSNIYIWSANASHLPYLIFAQYLKKCYPSHFHPLSNDAKEIMVFLGKKHLNAYPYQYYPDTPFGSFNLANCMIDDAAKIYEKDLTNPHIFYFQQLMKEGEKHLQNPEHELLVITIAPANWENFAFWVKRFFKKKLNKKAKTF